MSRPSFGESYDENHEGGFDMSRLTGPVARSQMRLLELGGCAVLTGVVAPHRPLGATSVARVVPSLGVEDAVARYRFAADAGAGEIVSAALTITDRSVRVTRTDGSNWESDVDDIVDVVRSAIEPCTVLVSARSGSCALLVPVADAERLEEALAQATNAVRARPRPAVTELLPVASYLLDTVPTPAVDAPDTSAAPQAPRPARRALRVVTGRADTAFRAVSTTGGLTVLATMILVGGYLLVVSLPALRAMGAAFITTSAWQPDVRHFGIAAVMAGTVLIALVALVVAVPLAIGTALFISEVVPGRAKGWAIAGVDLMAAVPSVVYGLWGKEILQGQVVGVARWLSTWMSWIPIFKVDGADPRNPLATASVYTASTFIAGLVVALMVIPIVCSISREVFSQAPAGEREGAYALGASRWGMIRAVVLPFGKGGMIGAVMLGLGRALGETVAVYLIISPVFKINFHILQTGSNSVSSLIALRQGDASGFGRAALMSAGLALFVITLVVNFTASTIVARSRSGAESEA